MGIPFNDLESTPLQIKTNSTMGSGDEISVELYDPYDSWFGVISLKFDVPWIVYCPQTPVRLSNPPTDVDKIWTFAKTNTEFIISCNGVELLKYDLGVSNDCVPSIEFIDKRLIMRFSSSDTATDYYRAKGKGLDLRGYLGEQIHGKSGCR